MVGFRFNLCNKFEAKASRSASDNVEEILVGHGRGVSRVASRDTGQLSRSSAHSIPKTIPLNSQDDILCLLM